MNSLLIQPMIQILEGEHCIEKFGMLFGLCFLGDAGTDKDDGNIVAIMRAQHLAMREQRRQNTEEMGLAFGMIFADEIHDDRTGGGDPDLLRLAAHQRGDAGRDLLGAERGFRCGIEPQVFESMNQLGRRHTGKLRHK